MPDQHSKKPQFDSYMQYTGMAFQLFAGILLGVWGGIKLDAWLHTKPWFTVILSLFGIAAGMYSVLKPLLQNNKKNKP